jgi:hypothetical protein
MKSKTFDTAIIGAGISGLACARHLQENNKDFILISKDIGGRILTSEDGMVNYGAFFVCSDYNNVLKYVKLHSRIKLSDFCFHEKNEKYALFEPKLLAYLIQFVKVIKILYKFRKALRLFRIKSETVSQKQAIESDSFLHEVYMKDAVDFVKENKLQSGTETYLSKALYSTTFSTIYELNAFSFLQFLLPLITPIYTFKFEKEKMIEPFKNKIIIDTVSKIRFKNSQYEIKSDKNLFYAKNIVLATGIGTSMHFANVKKTNKPVSTHMLHIKGKPKDMISHKKYHLFSTNNEVQAIADLEDSSYLFYYKNKRPLLEKYFLQPQEIASHFWDPAGTINGHILIDSNRGNNMYLIGDCNVAGLEESFITGIYAANQIIKKH